MENIRTVSFQHLKLNLRKYEMVLSNNAYIEYIYFLDKIYRI